MQRWARIVPDDHRRAFAAAHVLLRRALTWCLPSVPESDWVFRQDKPLSRPEVAGPVGNGVLRFNLSHAKDLVAVVATLHSACGVDVEAIPDEETCARLAKPVFSGPELAQWHKLPQSERGDRFCRLWTLKEATTKAQGLGLSVPFSSIEFALTDSVEAALIGDSTWTLTSHRLAREHYLSVAIDQPNTPIHWHHFTGGHSDPARPDRRRDGQRHRTTRGSVEPAAASVTSPICGDAFHS